MENFLQAEIEKCGKVTFMWPRSQVPRLHVLVLRPIRKCTESEVSVHSLIGLSMSTRVKPGTRLTHE